MALNANKNLKRPLKYTRETPRELVLLKQQQEAHGFRSNVQNTRQVSHRVTGEILQPLRYNASGGWKRGERI